jgi:hypothetical protein
MLSSVWKDPPSDMRRLPLVGALMNATDRVMDFFHEVYEEFIDWVFSSWRWRIGRLAIGPRSVVLRASRS